MVNPVASLLSGPLIRLLLLIGLGFLLLSADFGGLATSLENWIISEVSPF